MLKKAKCLRVIHLGAASSLLIWLTPIEEVCQDNKLTHLVPPPNRFFPSSQIAFLSYPDCDLELLVLIAFRSLPLGSRELTCRSANCGLPSKGWKVGKSRWCSKARRHQCPNLAVG